jgi:phosphatidylserine/phosphatidylglycerophosphate/cardiolipin synthase-like enzyme
MAKARAHTRLLIQPGDGITPIVQAINSAKSRVEIAIFRFDRSEIEKALASAVSRGVFVHALIAYTNRGGERNLRKLEMRLLAAGVTVARTADDLARYHGKYIIVDREELHLLAFNFTYLDMDHSRSFGLITRDPKLVEEAVQLFEADTKRQPYSPGLPTLVVSPVNARRQLASFLKGARKQLLIYDPEISDLSMIRLLEQRSQAGVEVRILGRLTRRTSGLAVRKVSGMRLHTRTMVRDGRLAFIGSQSLREVELGSRREVGVIFRDPKIIAQLSKTFEEDWQQVEKGQSVAQEAEPAAKAAKKVAKAVAKELPPVTPVLQVIVREMVGKNGDVDLDPMSLEATVKDAVKEAVQEVVQDVVESVVDQNGLPAQE